MSELAHLKQELEACRQELSRAQEVRSEHQLERMFTLSLDMICIAGTDGFFLRINPAFTRILGWSRAALLSRPFLDYVHPEDVQKTLDEMSKLVEGQPTVSFENRYQCADDTWKHLAWKAMPASDGLIYAVARDMTAYRRAVRQREAALAREAHQQGRIEMAAGILHDVGNLMTGIGSQATTLRDTLRHREALVNLRNTTTFLTEHQEPLAEALGEQRAVALIQLLGTIHDVEVEGRADAIQRVEKLLGGVRHAAELLATYRSYSQSGTPRREHLQISELFRDAYLLVEDGLSRRGGLLKLQVAPELPKLHIERSKALQILLNLLKNAIEAFDDTDLSEVSPTITLGAERNGDTVVLTIEDNGAGFDPALSEQLFSPDYSTKERSSGVGLASVRRVTESLGGTARLTSPGPGLGACAVITLPLESP